MPLYYFKPGRQTVQNNVLIQVQKTSFLEFRLQFAFKENRLRFLPIFDSGFVQSLILKNIFLSIFSSL